MSATEPVAAGARGAGQTRSLRWSLRLLAVVSIAVLHVSVYYLVLRINGGRPTTDLIDPAMALDRWIPYLGWTWVFYYLGDVYITGWGAYVFWRIPSDRVGRAAMAYAGMILIGGAVQLLVPVEAPWPDTFVAPQAWMHETLALQPRACLPSMHVALTVLPAAIALTVLRSRRLQVGSTLVAGLITVSTITLKEHYVLDAVTGVLLGLAAFGWWRAGATKGTGRAAASPVGGGGR